MVDRSDCEQLHHLPDSVRREIAILARQKKCRTSVWTPDIPTEWQPHTVRDRRGDFFTDSGAWEFLADLVESGCPAKPVPLDHPPGKRGWAIIIRLNADAPEIYIKIRLGSGKLIGYSFHYSRFS